ncbi:MAG: hypothetical protein CL678_03415 [Bdellovibrionaceae bacterium]|nr:hypothetical protein [Pseudobdellovibrionaceae bacterium]|tara:strand:- start:961 stop:1680 length:720 start_codon:yes stop_codon:yes gene_type:complete
MKAIILSLLTLSVSIYAEEQPPHEKQMDLLGEISLAEQRFTDYNELSFQNDREKQILNKSSHLLKDLHECETYRRVRTFKLKKDYPSVYNRYFEEVSIPYSSPVFVPNYRVTSFRTKQRYESGEQQLLIKQIVDFYLEDVPQETSPNITKRLVTERVSLLSRSVEQMSDWLILHNFYTSTKMTGWTGEDFRVKNGELVFEKKRFIKLHKRLFLDSRKSPNFETNTLLADIVDFHVCPLN